jgi:hypothetical protein
MAELSKAYATVVTLRGSVERRRLIGKIESREERREQQEDRIGVPGSSACPRQRSSHLRDTPCACRVC